MPGERKFHAGVGTQGVNSRLLSCEGRVQKSMLRTFRGYVVCLGKSNVRWNTGRLGVVGRLCVGPVLELNEASLTETSAMLDMKLFTGHKQIR
jgi:hypothetical protein